MQTNTWRLIITSPNSGDWNMAVDEAILESVTNHLQPPTLRLYSWNPPCLSLGRAQPFNDVDHENISLIGWGLVRRPTGGRAILHTDELTYSICARVDESHVHGGVIESYRKISGALLYGLELMGILADSKPKDNNEKHLAKDPVCFQYPSDYEITFGGKKIIGSAQARRDNTLLQHGSIPLFGDLTRILSGLKFESEMQYQSAEEKLLARAATLEEALGQRITWMEAARTIVQAVEAKFFVRLDHQTLSDREFAKAKALITEKYANSAWTEKV